jgi:diguanylate cyclase (GGDEF)-like protein
MTTVLEHLAELTGYRDRDAMDVTLVGALRDLLRPECVAIYRVVGEGDEARWLTRARQRGDDPVASADPLWTEIESLPSLQSQPLRAECAQLGEGRFEVRGARHTTMLPLVSELGTDGSGVAVLELETSAALTLEAMKTVSGVLRVYRNFQSLLDYSERDTLTGLLNRKTFDEAFLRITAAMRANAMPQPGDEGPAPSSERRLGQGPHVWLAVIDVDHFKKVNDSFGHLIGDEVLLLMSRLMRSTFRAHDQLYRFGGEEFVVLLRAPDKERAEVALERYRRSVQAYAFPRVGDATVSLGYSEVRASDTPTAAFERADKAVYHAKQNGRNQVAGFADLVARGVFQEGTVESDVELF